ncbi:hypothetical protein SERLA73DRAFT_175658 [Serpula lacrymans var. lacrymans S7.3]|uniref:Uncharacterized protein n=2 Tax=Serpula lacrymans var. lacrymans TaxID=341189 RepID=F8PL45_SERL3|nr:uncharacterized protein SERLADRAFT_458213 [Serpula lacrymans var. lacrymans S7.9]EGO03953.1 hypothetical protein SERLA73DRAFT_175658 [Serpula lacrymans var. lacrymans S7.3]EGO29873.1 hypothetical protein SERLADRAFT_458213 [Serpula lacrymans var. lacrymans S7.9]
MDEVERNLLYRVGYERRCERLGERLAQRETATRPRKKPKKAKRADATGAALVVRQKKDCDRKQHPTSKAVRPKNVRNTCKPSPSRFLTRSRGDGVSFSSC